MNVPIVSGKRFLHTITLVLIFGMTAGPLSGQCAPDTTCEDAGGDPGQICPNVLPPGIVGEAYESVVTILPPPSGQVMGVTVSVIKIRLDDIQNLPDGMEYQFDGNYMYPDTLYCLVLQGTPTETGVFPLHIKVTATVDVAGGINVPVTDSTSVVFTVNSATGIYYSPSPGSFEVIHCFPNPFYDKTRIGYRTRTFVETELKVFSLLGQAIYTEKLAGSSGTFYYQFTGQDLRPGTYIYTITTGEKAYTGRFMKVNE
jgi:hypothetical protein